jgi:hypothetical protein
MAQSNCGNWDGFLSSIQSPASGTSADPFIQCRYLGFLDALRDTVSSFTFFREKPIYLFTLGCRGHGYPITARATAVSRDRIGATFMAFFIATLLLLKCSHLAPVLSMMNK